MRYNWLAMSHEKRLQVENPDNQTNYSYYDCSYLVKRLKDYYNCYYVTHNQNSEIAKLLLESAEMLEYLQTANNLLAEYVYLELEKGRHKEEPDEV